MDKITYREGFTAENIPKNIEELIKGRSYKENSQVKLVSLAYLKVKHYNFQHKICQGELIVAWKLAQEILEIFAELFDSEYEIEKIRLVDHYDADDEKSMSDNNSSAFNFRTIADTDTVSMHGYGRAIDINPLYNPYIVGEKIMPATAVQYSNRELAFCHKIDNEDLCCKIFKAHGWNWGGDWTNTKDYQHFYKDKKSQFKSVLRRFKRLAQH